VGVEATLDSGRARLETGLSRRWFLHPPKHGVAECDRQGNRLSLGLFSTDAFGLARLRSATNETDRKASSEERIASIQKLQSDLRQSEFGAIYLHSILANARSEIEEKGRFSEQTRRSLLDASGLCDYALVKAILKKSAADDTEPTDTAVEEGRKQLSQSQRRALVLIDRQLEVLEWTKRQAAKKEELVEEAELRSLCLPSSDITDKLLRYETHLERQLYRAMDQRERLAETTRGRIRAATIECQSLEACVVFCETKPLNDCLPTRS